MLAVLTGSVFGLIAWVMPQLGVFTLVLLVVGRIGVTVWQEREKINVAHSHIIFEGGGIRRGLTPVEAGILLEIPPMGLLTVSVSALLQKGTLMRGEDGQVEFWVRPENQASKDTINPVKRTAERKKAARNQGKVLSVEEDMLLEMFWQGILPNSSKFPISLWMDKASQECDFKMSGYDRAQSVKYYKNYMAHRLNGVGKGFFPEDEFVPWMVLHLFVRPQNEGELLDIIKKTRPSWLHAGESLSDWVKTFAGLKTGNS